MYRVLMIAPTPFFADRGCHVRILGEILALQRQRCDVTVCTYHNGRDVDGVRTQRIVDIPWYDKLEPGPSNHKYYLDALLLMRSLRAGLSERPDVIHAHLHEGAAIAAPIGRILRRPVVMDYQGSLTDELAAHDYGEPGGVVLRSMGAVERWIDGTADMIVASTTRSAAALKAQGRSVRTVLDGVDTMKFRPLGPATRKEARARWGFPEDSVVALFLGVLTEYQGIDLLLEHAAEALDAVPRLRLVIAGYPAEEYQERAAELGLGDRVVFTGKVDFRDTPELTAAADIAVTPKISTSEGNLKVYNYLACGLPVVAFDTQVNREILGDLGVYAPLGDGGAFAAALAGLAVDGARIRALGVAGRRLAETRLSWDRAATELMDVYNDIGAHPTAHSTFEPERATAVV